MSTWVPVCVPILIRDVFEEFLGIVAIAAIETSGFPGYTAIPAAIALARSINLFSFFNRMDSELPPQSCECSLAQRKAIAPIIPDLRCNLKCRRISLYRLYCLLQLFD